MSQPTTKQSNALIRPQVYQFRLGDMRITHILEGHVVRHDLHPFVATNATPAEVEALANRHHLPYPALEHSFTTTLIETAGKLVAIDPGFGENSPMPSAGYFSGTLPAAGYTSDDVDIVLISHSHPDHIGNLMTAGRATFANAEVVYGRREFDYWQRGENIADFRKPTLELFQKVALPLQDRLRFIDPEDTIAPGITAVDAFGHSAGHLAFHIESAGQQLMMLNDTVAHYVASFAQPDWAFSMDDDPDAAAETRRRLLTQVSQDNIPVTGFHIPFPSIGYVETAGTGFVFKPASYQFNV
jgi:glyoxylase-like metal-dependent hydrolase (beta-lactamase superfamily II)